MQQRRTDLAVEAHEIWQNQQQQPGREHPGIQSSRREREGIPITEVTVSTPEAGELLGKPPGIYLTLELDPLFRREEESFSRSVRAVAEELSPLLPPGPALVAGLGSRTVTADLVGPGTADRLLATRHLVEQVPEHFGSLRPVAALAPGVLASTGIESASVISAVVRELQPAVVIAVDALASRSLTRLCRTVQIADSGIVPGSGVGNHRHPLTRDSLGVPVLTVGAPTVVDGATLALDLLESAGIQPPAVPLEDGENLFVCPRDIDQKVADLCKVLGWGISLALNPELSLEDLAMLLE